MSFINAQFAAFFLVVFGAFWLFRKKKIVRSSILILASYAFFANWNPIFGIALLYVSVFDYYLSKLSGKSENPAFRMFLLGISIFSNLGVILLFKNLVTVAGWFDGGPLLLGLVKDTGYSSVPFSIGIALYIFQSLGYSIDVYRKEISSAESLNDYLLFIAFFPRILAGPIVKAREFLPSLKISPGLDRKKRGLALFLILSGLVKKMVFADYLGFNLVDKVFDLPLLFSTIEVILAIYAYTIQIYCEFSGYTDLALGLALFLGMELSGNFDFPLRASNIRDFWRRWFTSVSFWFRDYVYKSLGGGHSRWSWMVYINLIVTMLLVGLWNGAAWTYIAWGASHGLLLAITRFYHQIKHKTGTLPESKGIGRVVGIFFTFHFVVITWALFRATDFEIVSNLLTILKAGVWHAPNLTAPVIAVLIAGIAGALMPKKVYLLVRDLFTRLPLPVQAALIFIVLLFVFKVSTAETIPFVYERF